MEPSRDSRVLVTGGAGFIGRRLVTRLTNNGRAVAVFDNLASGLPVPSGAAATYRADIRSREALDAAFREFRPDSLVHLAAIHHIPTCETERAFSLDVNVVGTESVLAAAEEHRVSTVVIASSGAVYDTVDAPLDEHRTAVEPHDNYALAKVTNERQASFWQARTGGRLRIARIFNAVGPNDPNAHLLPDILAQLRDPARNRVRLGNTTPKRDYVWVEDVAEGLAAMLAADGDGLEVLNLCSGVEHSVADLVAMIGECLGRPLTIEVDAARVRPVDRPHQLGSPLRARERVGWQASRGIRESLAAIIDAEGLEPAR